MAMRHIGGPRHGQQVEEGYWGPTVEFRYTPPQNSIRENLMYTLVYSVDRENELLIYKEIHP